MKSLSYLLLLILILSCSSQTNLEKNPFFTGLNVPVDYANISAQDIEEYANVTVENAKEEIEEIKENKVSTFKNTYVALDDVINQINNARNICKVLFRVSPDSLSRTKGTKGYQLIDSLSTSIFSDKALYVQLLKFNSSDSYHQLKGHKKILADDISFEFKRSGVSLKEYELSKYIKLSDEINQLTFEFSENINASNEVILIDAEGIEGLSENFKNTYKVGEFQYEIPVTNSTLQSIMDNAKNEETRKSFYKRFYNIAADKNLAILDNLILKRYKLANLLGFPSYAAYNLKPKMAGQPEVVWDFIYDLVDKSKGKAKSDIELLTSLKKNDSQNENDCHLQIWDRMYYTNQLMKLEYNVNHEKIREYLPMEYCLQGILDIFQELLGLEFKKVQNPSVWHQEVEMYNVFEGTNLKGRFYLDLFPRPNKASWFYGITVKSGKKTGKGYEIPEALLLGNFTRPTDTTPSLISFNELTTLFHEFGHIIDVLSYTGEFQYLAEAETDFLESMSQIFENWVWDYEILSMFARHYKTGEVLPKETFENMLRAKNVNSGLYTLFSLRKCIYDLHLYDQYNPESPVNTDELWKTIDDELGAIQFYVEGTHPQASWTHINRSPVYYYGYLWADVYAQDMFTKFEKNGLLDKETGTRFRKLILANGKQQNTIESVEEFLGRPLNNEAFIRSLGLN